MQRSWRLALCAALVCTLSCLASAGPKTREHFSQLTKDLTERSEVVAQKEKALFTMGEKAIIEAFNKVAEREDRLESRPSDREKNKELQQDVEGNSQGFFYGMATVLRMIPTIREYFAPRPTLEELEKRIKEEAEVDALRTARILKQTELKKEAARIKISNALKAQRMAKHGLREDEEPEEPQDEPVCHLGRETKTARTINSCSTRRTCRAWKFNSTLNVTVQTPAIDVVNNTEIELTHMLCDNLPVSFLDDYNSTKCYVRAIGCSNSTPIGDCPIEVLCESPSYLAFGMNDGRYAFGGTTDVIYCNGTAVEDPTIFDNRTLPAECEVKRIPGPTNGTCYTINATGRVSVQSVSCFLYCFRIVNETQCVCPADYTGVNCEQQQNITCTGYLVSPLPKCITGGEQDHLVYDKPCLIYKDLSDTTIEMNWNISCKFSSESLRGVSRPDGFDYWLDTPDLRLSAEPNWTVTLESFQFSSFKEPIGAGAATKMTRKHLTGEEVMTLKFKTDKAHIVGGRAYVELGFETNFTPPGIRGGVMRRFFLDDSAGGYKGGSGKDHILADGLGAGEISIIVVVTVVGIAVIAGIGRCLYERWMEEKVSDEEVGEGQNKSKKAKQD